MENSLSVENLVAGARKFAELAMAARAHPDHELFALQAGVAVERLAKASLTSRNPALLLEIRGSVEMLFHLTGQRDAKKIRTIGMTEAVARLRQLDVLPREDPKLDLLIELRNGVAHSSTSDITEDLLPTMATTIDVLLLDIGEDRSSFWGNWHTVVTLAREEARDRLTREVQLRVQHASYLFNARISRMPRNAADRYLHSIRKDAGADWSYEVNANGETFKKGVECPACSSLVTVPLTAPSEHNNIGDEPEVVVMESLICYHCQLTLFGCNELQAAGLEPIIYADSCDEPDFVRSARKYILNRRAFPMLEVKITATTGETGSRYQMFAWSDVSQPLSGGLSDTSGDRDAVHDSVGSEHQRTDRSSSDDGRGTTAAA